MPRKKGTDPTAPVVIRVPVSQRSELMRIAAEHDQSLGWVVRQAIGGFLSDDLPRKLAQAEAQIEANENAMVELRKAARENGTKVLNVETATSRLCARDRAVVMRCLE